MFRPRCSSLDDPSWMFIPASQWITSYDRPCVALKPYGLLETVWIAVLLPVLTVLFRCTLSLLHSLIVLFRLSGRKLLCRHIPLLIIRYFWFQAMTEEDFESTTCWAEEFSWMSRLDKIEIASFNLCDLYLSEWKRQAKVVRDQFFICFIKFPEVCALNWGCNPIFCLQFPSAPKHHRYHCYHCDSCTFSVPSWDSQRCSMTFNRFVFSRSLSAWYLLRSILFIQYPLHSIAFIVFTSYPLHSRSALDHPASSPRTNSVNSASFLNSFLIPLSRSPLSFATVSKSD